MNIKRFQSYALSLVCLALANGLAGHANVVKKNHVEVELVPSTQSVQPGSTVDVALRMKMDKNWHTYWVNPGGEIGYPTSIEWTLPAGFTASAIQWPMPHKFVDSFSKDEPPMVSYGYKDEVFLLNEFVIPDTVKLGEQITISATVKWLACEQMCIPGSADLEVSLPVLDMAPTANAIWKDDLDSARNLFPIYQSAWKTETTVSGDRLELNLVPPDRRTNQLMKLEFYPHQPKTIVDWAPQPFEILKDRYRITLKLASSDGPERALLSGLLVAEPGWDQGGAMKAIAVDLRLSDLPVAQSSVPIGLSESDDGGQLSISLACLLAFLGGVILNLMPCVLPVLAIKVLSFVKKVGEHRTRIWLHGFVYTLGVLATFWLLSGTLILLRRSGDAVGWGFQLQSPTFLIVLCFFLFLFSLSLFGVFEIGTSLIGVGAESSKKSGFSGTFFTGVIAVVVATPCTAPFMGTAMGFALTQTPIVSLLIFSFLGLGLASPYVVLTAFPGLLRYVPKPGAWMESFKQFMGFLLMATVIWLLWVLGGLLGNDALGSILIALLITGIGSWIYGRWGTPVKETRVRVVARLVSAAIIIGALTMALQVRPTTAVSGAARSDQESSTWEVFSTEKFDELRAKGQPVFIDFTADWCLTCKVNERIAFTSKVMKQFKQSGVVTMVADFTSKNDTISRVLSSYGRSGVPLYVLYGHGSESPPIILPQLLTPQIVLNALEKI